MKRVFLATLAALFSVLISHAQTSRSSFSPNELPWNNPDYEDFFERVETRLGKRFLSTSRPRLVSGEYSEASAQWPHRDHELSRFGRESTRYRHQLAMRRAIVLGSRVSTLGHGERRALGMGAWPVIFGELYRDGFHFYAYGSESDHLALSLQPIYGLEIIDAGDDRQSISRFTGGLRVEAGYAAKLYGMVDFRDHTEAGNGPYDSRSDLYEDRWAAIELKGDNSTSYDISESLIQYYGPNLSVAAGRGRHKWGPSYFGGLLLDDHAPPFDYGRFDATFSAVRYMFLHGFLESQISADSLYVNPDGRPRTIHSQKYLSAQRLELAPRDNVLVGFSQSVIYGDRGVQLGYLTPLNFLYSVQHSNDDQDNLLIAFDGKWRIKPGLKVYAEFLLDDVVVSDIFGNSGGGSKNAYTLGVHGNIPKPLWEKFDARFEYTKVRPFVYSHFFDVNKYSHWTSPLGYTKEPNSEFIHFRVGASFYPLYAAVTYTRQNHGANTDDNNVGGSIDAANYADTETDFVFLDGQFVRTETISIFGRYEVLPNLNLLLSVASISQSRADNRTEIHAGFGWNL